MSKFKVGIMGAGKIAETMATTLKGMKGISFYAIASRTEEKAQAFAKQHGAKKAYGSYEAMLKDPKVDLVYIATPHSEHYANAKLCIEYKKPILCEKAFTANAKQAKEILALAKQEKVFITEAIWTRYMPMVDMIKEVLDKGVIGEPKVLTANLSYSLGDIKRLQDPELAGGSLLDLGVYPINFASIFFGTDIKSVSSTCTYTDTGVDEQETITIIYQDGRIANLTASQCCIGDRKGIIQGNKGYMVIENINNYESFTVYDEKHKKVLSKKAPKQITGYEYEVEACRRALAAGELSCYEMPHEETIRVMEFMDDLRKEWGVIYPFEQDSISEEAEIKIPEEKTEECDVKACDKAVDEVNDSSLDFWKSRIQ